MKRILSFTIAALLACSLFAGCADTPAETPESSPSPTPVAIPSGAAQIVLSDEGVTVNGESAGSTPRSGVHTARDIIYYEEGHDFTYGEGTIEDEHSAAEAAAHTVVHISEPGIYVISGSITGQIAVDLGEDAEDDPSAVATLILNGADITCTVAPGIIFYNVYECADKDNASMEVSTTAAGANLVINDGTENTVNGSYVARIYKSIELNGAGTEVADSKKLHKYDGAVYSKMSMNVSGNGSLAIFAENEGLDTEMHLTINGGDIRIVSGNDGINTNEDGVSVTTINGGALRIRVDGSTGEGDGIDSNGWLVVNGGTVFSAACADSADAGLDANNGVYINGGTVCASGNMLDAIASGGQNCAIFTFAQRQSGTLSYRVTNTTGDIVAQWTPENSFSILLISVPGLVEGEYALWQGEDKLAVYSGTVNGRPGGQSPGGAPEPPEGMEPGEIPEPPEGTNPGEAPEMPEDMQPGTAPEMPEGDTPPEGQPPQDGGAPGGDAPPSAGEDGNFTVTDGENSYVTVG